MSTHRFPDLDPNALRATRDALHADKQMNFGFVFGDEGIDEPYFYVTAYPLPDALPRVELPAGTTWRSGGFSGAVLLYGDRSNPSMNTTSATLCIWTSTQS